MTVALVHDFLTQRGGAERVVLALAKALRDPVIVTAVYAPEETYPDFAGLEVRAARTVGSRAARNFRAGILTYPKTFRSFDLEDCAVAVVSSSAFAHHIRHPRSAVYWHTPPRFLHDPAAYMPTSAPAQLERLARGLSAPLRSRDLRAARQHRLYAANSCRTAKRLHEAYGLQAPVIYPPLDTEKFAAPLTAVRGPARALVVSRLLPYKRVALAIEACRLAGIPLTVVGEGPDRSRLHELASSSVTFLEGISDAELVAAYAEHTLVICPGLDDFGYIPLEAAYAGRAVVASAGAGAEESVRHGTSGFLVPGSDPQRWAAAILAAVDCEWNPAQLRDGVLGFAADSFISRVGDWLLPLIDPSELLADRPLAAAPAPPSQPQLQTL